MRGITQPGINNAISSKELTVILDGPDGGWPSPLHPEHIETWVAWLDPKSAGYGAVTDGAMLLEHAAMACSLVADMAAEIAWLRSKWKREPYWNEAMEVMPSQDNCRTMN